MSGQRAYQLDLTRAFVPVNDSGRYDRRLEAMRGRAVSGVYAIMQERTGKRLAWEVMYVGESHTGRLFDTITRHFRAWTRPVQRDGRRFGGTMYDRERVWIAFVETAPEDAAAVQYANIQALRPRDNTIDGGGAVSAVELPV